MKTACTISEKVFGPCKACKQAIRDRAHIVEKDGPCEIYCLDCCPEHGTPLFRKATE